MSYKLTKTKVAANMLLILLLFISICRAEWALTQSDLTQNTFQSSDIKGWSDSRFSQCNSFNTHSMVGGYQKFNGQNSSNKLFKNLAPHFRVKVKFTLFFIDCVNNSVKNEAIKLKADSKEVFSYSLLQLDSNQDFCGSNNYPDQVIDFTAEFSHSNDSLNLEFFDTFDSESNAFKSWGFRNVQISMLNCYERCASCSGDWSNQCLTCFDNQMLNSNNECVCKDGYYYSNYQCVLSDMNASQCEIQLFKESNNIVFQVSSQLIQKSQVQYLRININLILSYTSTIIPQSCQSQIRQKMMIRNKLTNEYIDFSDQQSSYVITNTPGSQIVLEIPMTQIQALSQVQSQQGNTVFSVLQLAVNIGNIRKYVRVNRFAVYTSLANQNSQIETFAANIDEQVTDGCKTTYDDCVVIADLDMDSFLCSDETCLTEKPDRVYTVKFKYSKFTKFITKTSAYFKGDDLVLNLSNQFKVVSQKQGVTIFSLPMVQASKDCLLLLTVNIKDDPDSRRLRSLYDNYQSSSKQQGVKLTNFQVVSKEEDQSNTNKTQNSNSPLLKLTIMLHLIALLFIF